MEILKLHKNSYDKLKNVAKVINDGKVVVFPTETVYGIGVNGLDVYAIKKLYNIKVRDYNKPISLLVSNYEMIESVANIVSPIEKKIIECFFPGPITLILNKKDVVPDILTSGTNTVGIRMPDSEFCLRLIDYVGNPLATSSANISGRESGVDIENIYAQFGDNVDLYVDNDEKRSCVSSSVVRVVDDEIVILRNGTISKEEILKKINFM